MQFYTRKEIAKQLRSPDADHTLLDWQLNGALGAAFEYSGRVFAVCRSSHERVGELEVEGFFQLAARPDVDVELPEYIGVSSFYALPGSQIVGGQEGCSLEDLGPLGSMIFEPTCALSVHQDDLLLSDDDIEEIERNWGMRFEMQNHAIHTRERENLLKIVGLLVLTVVEAQPEFARQNELGINIERLANKMLDDAERLAVGTAGISKRSIRDKITLSLRLLDDFRHGRVR